MNLEKFEKIWEREIKKSDYIMVYLKNGALINTEKYEIITSHEIMLWYGDHWVALVPISVIKNVEGRTWIYGKIDDKNNTEQGSD